MPPQDPQAEHALLARMATARTAAAIPLDPDNMRMNLSWPISVCRFAAHWLEFSIGHLPGRKPRLEGAAKSDVGKALQVARQKTVRW